MRKRIRARSAKSAMKKARTSRSVPSKVNYIKGSKKSGMRTYSVTCHARKKK